MLQETTEALAKLKNQKRLDELKKAKRKYMMAQTKKWTWRISLGAFIVCALFLPEATGGVIGNWIHDFFGSMIKNIQN